MPYITGIERRGIEQGMLQQAREDIMEVLQTRFGNLPKTLAEMIKAINDSAMLKRLFRQSIRVESVPAFEQKMTEVIEKNGQLSASS